jgi:2-alkenal reductase
MKRALACAALAFLAGCGGGTKTVTTKVEVVRPAAQAQRSSRAPSVYKTEAPGVVTLIALEGGGGNNVFGRASRALGSGFVVDTRGYIATNAHVVTNDSGKKAQQLYVAFADGNKVAGQVVGADPDSDIALVKIDPTELRGPGARLVALPLGSTSALRVGDPVAAIGSPFGEEQSLSVGVVSALNREIDSLTNFTIGNAIQTDAAINHGNSGGPLLDSSGKVVGINSQIQSTGGGGEGVGFAVPVETVKRSLAQLRAHGHVDYAYLGISSVSLYPQLAARLGIKALGGALIDQVVRGGPAAVAGLHGARSHIDFQDLRDIPVGSDVIVAIDGKPLTQAIDVSDLIGAHRPGDRVRVRILRDGRQRTATVTLGKRPEKPAGAR